MKPMDRVEKEEGPNSLVQIAVLPSKSVQRHALLKQLIEGGFPANVIERLIAYVRIRRSDDTNQLAHTTAP
jgi:hypothetical protein